MAIYIDSFDIYEFRGIKNLKLNGLNHVNIIAGDNNSGKTSILEAIALLKNPLDLYNVLKTSRIREDLPYFYTSTLFDSFINMLPHDSLHMSVSASGLIGKVDLDLLGELKNILVDKNTIGYTRVGRNSNYESEETETLCFAGEYKTVINSNFDSVSLEFTQYTRFNDLPRHRINYLNISYLSPAKHLSGNNISNIVRSGSYKELCVYLLQLFDSEIEDILYLKNDLNHRPVECIRHKTLGTMPLSTYGDGIKKVISLANAIASAKSGILMIDEIETSIHSKYYEDIFAFLFKACQRFDVQLFITTHNKEAIDALLTVQEYGDKIVENDPVNVITFRTDKSSRKTFARVMSGSEVLQNREKYDFEVRI